MAKAKRRQVGHRPVGRSGRAPEARTCAGRLAAVAIAVALTLAMVGCGDDSEPVALAGGDDGQTTGSSSDDGDTSGGGGGCGLRRSTGEPAPEPEPDPDAPLATQLEVALEAIGESREVWAVEPVEVSFLTDWQLLEAELLQGGGCSPPPEVYHIGFGDGEAVFLEDDLEAFDAMVVADGTGVADALVAEELAVTRTEVSGERRLVLSSEADALNEFVNDHAAEISPPTVEESSDGWQVTLYDERCGRDPDLQRQELTIHPDGRVDEAVETLYAAPEGEMGARCPSWYDD